MNKLKMLLGLSLLVLGGLSLAPKAVEAYKGDPNTTGPNCTQERHDEMTVAFENNDYDAWKDLMAGKGRVTQVVNEQNFAQFAQAHKLALEGKTDEANQIRTELGLGSHDRLGSGQGMGYGRTGR